MKRDAPAGQPGDREHAGVDAHRLRYQQLVEFAPDGHLMTDSQGVIVEANQAAAAALRCPKEFLIGKPLGLFVTEGHRQRFYKCLSRLHGGAHSDEFESRVGRRDDLREVVIRVAVADPEASGEVGFRWLVRDITERQRAEAARDDLLHRLVKAQEDERRRVARELHDSFGQILSALLLGLRAVRDAGPLPPAALERLDEVQLLTADLGRATHDLAMRLRPSVLDDLGLVAAVRHYLEDWSERAGVAVQFLAVGPEAERLPPDVETALYRVVQEALTNVVRHADARHVSVLIERQDGRAIMVVEDDGVGFDPDGATATGRLGLLGMRERAGLVGGELVVESSPGGGTSVIVRVPIAATHAPG